MLGSDGRPPMEIGSDLHCSSNRLGIAYEACPRLLHSSMRSIHAAPLTVRVSSFLMDIELTVFSGMEMHAFT